MGKKIVLLSVIVLGLFLVTACTQDANKPKANSGSFPSGTDPATTDANQLIEERNNEPATITFYTATANEPIGIFMENYGNPIKNKFPHYTIQYVRAEKGTLIADLLATGTMNIDIIIDSVAGTYTDIIRYDLQSDISELIKKFDYNLERLEPQTIEMQKIMANGGIYGLPFSTSSTVLFYNRDIFDMFGVDYPHDGMTWDDLYVLAQRMTRTYNEIEYKGLAMAFTHLMRLNQLSASTIDLATNRAVLTSDDYKQAFSNLVRFFQIPGNHMPTQVFSLNAQNDAFYKDHTAAMMLHLTRAAKKYLDEVNWDVLRQPYFQDKPGVGPQTYPYYFYLTNVSKVRDATFQVLAFVTSDEFQKHIVEQGFDSILTAT